MSSLRWSLSSGAYLLIYRFWRVRDELLWTKDAFVGGYRLVIRSDVVHGSGLAEELRPDQPYWWQDQVLNHIRTLNICCRIKRSGLRGGPCWAVLSCA